MTRPASPCGEDSHVVSIGHPAEDGFIMAACGRDLALEVYDCYTYRSLGARIYELTEDGQFVDVTDQVTTRTVYSR